MLFDEFDGISREEWLEKITADLKGTAVDTLQWHYDSDIAVDPFTHADDPDATTSYLPRTLRWEIGETFTVTDDMASNAEILEGLIGGVQALHLKVMHPPDWGVLLKDVQLELIHTTIECAPGLDEGTLITDFMSFVRESGMSPDTISWSTRGSTNRHGSRAMAFTIPGSLSVVDGIVTVLRQVVQNPHPAEFVTSISSSYFIEIARLRALKILDHNLRLALDMEPTPARVEVHFSDQFLSEDANQNMIKAGSLTLSAVLGGADRIFIRIVKTDQNPTPFHRRIARNVHHILRFESHIDQLSDPVSGAYYLEKLTRQIVHMCWERLITQIKKDGR